MKLAAVVVLYQPEDDVFDNVATYWDDVDRLYVVDNSDTVNTQLVGKIKKHPSVVYQSLGGNQGIAKALNIGLCLANQDGFTHLMTMDQDSKFDVGSLLQYRKKAAHIFLEKANLILCGLNHAAYHAKHPDWNYEVANEVISSGMIMDIKKALAIGAFLEKLFIDYVDYEFCYRAEKFGYICMVVNTCRLIHQIGSVHPTTAYGIHFNNHNEHGKVRQYYLIRNGLYTMRHYPKKIGTTGKSCIKNILKIFLVEDDKKEKLRYVGYGIRDFVRNNYGKFV